MISKSNFVFRGNQIADIKTLLSYDVPIGGRQGSLTGLFLDKKNGVVLFSGNNTVHWNVEEDFSQSRLIVHSQGRGSDRNPKWNVSGDWNFVNSHYALVIADTESKFNLFGRGVYNKDHNNW